MQNQIERTRVFISAKSADFEHARRVFHFLKSRGIAVFMSAESLPDLGNTDYRKEIDRALDQTEHMVVVTSSAVGASQLSKFAPLTHQRSRGNRFAS
jgi:ferritin